MIRLSMLCVGVCLVLGVASAAQGADLFSPSPWASLATDRRAAQVGDSLTVIVYENSLGQNTARTGSRRGAQLGAQWRTASHEEGPAQASLSGQYDAEAQNGRSGKLVGQISVVVDAILANGDLRVSGRQVLNINGERTTLGVQGRVRPGDITTANTVLSSRLAEAQIDYNGSGYVSRGGKPGVLGWVFNWLGLL